MGAGIGIDVNGMKAIDAIDPSLRKWFNEEGHSLASSVINDDKGEPWPPCMPCVRPSWHLQLVPAPLAVQPASHALVVIATSAAQLCRV